MKKKKDYTEIWGIIERNHAALFKEYGGITHYIPETEKWDYAILENYTNYQDGFLMPDFESYKGMPIFDHPRFGRLYLRWDVPYYALAECEKEKYLCFDRHGNKYTISFTHAPMPHGNPSYFRVLPKVKKYTPKRKQTTEVTK